MSNKQVKVVVPYPIFFLLFLLFLGLKLAGKITWSWWLVTAPLWGVPATILAIFALVSLVILVRTLFGKR
jgi:hypothetical protein